MHNYTVHTLENRSKSKSK